MCKTENSIKWYIARVNSPSLVFKYRLKLNNIGSMKCHNKFILRWLPGKIVCKNYESQSKSKKQYIQLKITSIFYLIYISYTKFQDSFNFSVHNNIIIVTLQ